jgi:hypothetical protein
MTARSSLRHAEDCLNTAQHANDAWGHGSNVGEAQTYALIGILKALIDLTDAVKAI